MKTKTPLLLTFDLEHCSQETVARLLRDPFTEGRLLDRITRLHNTDHVLMELLLAHPKVLSQTLLFLFNHASADFKKRIQQLKKDRPGVSDKGLVPFKAPGGGQTSGMGGVEGAVEVEERTLYQRIQSMTVAEKVQFALRAGKDARGILLKDPNRQVSLAVLGSPKITEDEILLIAQSRNVSDEILRTVGQNKDWLKNYSVLFALVSNPKTPLGISMPLLPLVRPKDLGLLSKNRNVPEAIRTGANRLLLMRQKQS